MLDQDIVIPVAVQYAFSYPPGSLNDLLVIQQISWEEFYLKYSIGINLNGVVVCICIYRRFVI